MVQLRDLQRTVLLYSTHRSGTNLFKHLLADIAKFHSVNEIFARTTPQDRKNNSFDFFAGETHVGIPEFFLETDKLLSSYMEYVYELAPKKRPIVIDLKYSQAARFGADSLHGIPLLLKKFVIWQLPIIHLVRCDFVAQAISHLVAIKTGRFIEVGESLSGEPAPDGQRTKGQFHLSPEAVYKLARSNRLALEMAYDHLNVLRAKHILLFYEDLDSARWRPQIRRCLRFLNRYAEIPPDLKPRTVRQHSTKRVSNITEIVDYIADMDPSLLRSSSFLR